MTPVILVVVPAQAEDKNRNVTIGVGEPAGRDEIQHLSPKFFRIRRRLDSGAERGRKNTNIRFHGDVCVDKKFDEKGRKCDKRVSYSFTKVPLPVVSELSKSKGGFKRICVLPNLLLRNLSSIVSDSCACSQKYKNKLRESLLCRLLFGLQVRTRKNTLIEEICLIVVNYCQTRMSRYNLYSVSNCSSLYKSLTRHVFYGSLGKSAMTLTPDGE